MKKDLGYLHVYCGDGKGKTTAALGLAIRAAGRNMNVVIIQFLKSMDTGELNILSKIENITVLRSNKKFPFIKNMNLQQKEEIKEIHNEMLKKSIDMCYKETCDVLILDEIISAYNYNYIDKEICDNFLNTRPKNTEIVITGRNPIDKFIDMADYVSEIKKIKHPFDTGINARVGIEL